MPNNEFEKISKNVSLNIIGTDEHPLDFEEGEPVKISNINEILDSIVRYALLAVKYKGGSREYAGKKYVNGNYYPFIREVALKRNNGIIEIDKYEEESLEEHLLSLYFPEFEYIAKVDKLPFIGDDKCYLPFRNQELCDFLTKGFEPMRFSREIKNFVMGNPRFFIYNTNPGILHRASTFQGQDEDNDKKQYHVHIVLNNNEESLSLSGLDIQDEKQAWANGRKGHLGHIRDIGMVKLRGEQGIIYIRLDDGDIIQIKQNPSNLNGVIERVLTRTLSHELLGLSMKFQPYDSQGGKYILSPLIYPS